MAQHLSPPPAEARPTVPPARGEWLATLLVAAAGACLWCFGGALPAPARVVAWAALAVLVAVFLRRGWLRLFGPVLFYDAVTSARRGRHILFRALYAGLLFLCLLAVFSDTWRYGESWTYRARLAENCFYTFMLVQLLAVLILTPAYVAGGIADEKHRRTIDYLFTTDLRNRDIVFGKLGSRLGGLALFVLTGLPILSGLQFLGGIDPNLVLAGYAFTGLTMLGLGGVSILCSACSPRPRDAIVLAYLVVVAYYAVSFILVETVGNSPSAVLFPAVVFFSSGNLLLVMFEIARAMDSGTVREGLPGLLAVYGAFHGTVGVACIAWTALRLRPLGLREATRPRSARTRIRLFGRPPVGADPVRWKELHVEGGIRLNWPGRAVVAVLFLATYYPILAILSRRYASWREDYFAEEMNTWVRLATAAVGSLLLLAVAVRASNCVSGERDRQTLDSLLATPLTAGEILSAKWYGNVVSIRLAWLWLGSIWLVGLLTGGLSLFALPFVIAAWFVYAGCFSVIGCWFSLTAKNSFRATVYTLVTAVAASVGHWLVWMCCIPLGAGGSGGIEPLARFQLGLTPPAVLAILPFRAGDWQRVGEVYAQLYVFSLMGLFLWGMVVALVLWNEAKSHFRSLTNREEESLLAPPAHRPLAEEPAPELRPEPTVEEVSVAPYYPPPEEESEMMNGE